MGGDPNQQREEVTEEELRDMVAAQVTFTPQQRVIIDGAFEIAERTLEQVLVPRSQVFVLDPRSRVSGPSSCSTSRATPAPRSHRDGTSTTSSGSSTSAS